MQRWMRLLGCMAFVAAAPSCGSGDRGAPPARVAGVELAHERLRLADFQAVPGTSYLFAPLVTNSSDSSYGSDPSGRAKDLLFFDATTKSAHWLIGESTQKLRFYALIQYPPLPRYWAARSSEGHESKALGVLFERVSDAKDSSPTTGGKGSIGIASPDGTNPTILIEDVSGLLGHHLVSEESLIVFYNRQGELWAADIVPTSRSINSDSRVSADPQARPQ